eukprot:TRINITY_DN12764_c0_g1_i1.p1 TRINITY_DN12764_c0_g1~~TRINITY_DN12764_c0_g1_i1.p1  ORF type:complete len:173 (-),score=56.74 TRINITY_DN12764_c0_g1_i1:825-1286(-)
MCIRDRYMGMRSGGLLTASQMTFNESQVSYNLSITMDSVLMASLTKRKSSRGRSVERRIAPPDDLKDLPENFSEDFGEERGDLDDLADLVTPPTKDGQQDVPSEIDELIEVYKSQLISSTKLPHDLAESLDAIHEASQETASNDFGGRKVLGK